MNKQRTSSNDFRPRSLRSQDQRNERFINIASIFVAVALLVSALFVVATPTAFKGQLINSNVLGETFKLTYEDTYDNLDVGDEFSIIFQATTVVPADQIGSAYITLNNRPAFLEVVDLDPASPDYVRHFNGWSGASNLAGNPEATKIIMPTGGTNFLTGDSSVMELRFRVRSTPSDATMVVEDGVRIGGGYFSVCEDSTGVCDDIADYFSRPYMKGTIFLKKSVAAPPSDRDGDGVPDIDDNCPDTPNPLQEDTDGDGVGDACQGVCLQPDLGPGEMVKLLTRAPVPTDAYASVFTTETGVLLAGSGRLVDSREFVSTDEEYIYRSTDNGATWVPTHTFPGTTAAVTDFAELPNGDLFAIVNTDEESGVFPSVWKSVNQGLTWTRVAEFPPRIAPAYVRLYQIITEKDGAGTKLYISYRDNSDTILMERGFVKVSADGGASWTQVGQGFIAPSSDNYPYRTLSMPDGTLLTATTGWVENDSRVFIFNAATNLWVPTAGTLPSGLYTATDLIMGETDNKIYYSAKRGERDSRVLQSTDKGNSWTDVTPVHASFVDDEIVDLYFDETSNNLFALTGTETPEIPEIPEIYASNNNGQTWQFMAQANASDATGAIQMTVGASNKLLVAATAIEEKGGVLETVLVPCGTPPAQHLLTVVLVGGNGNANSVDSTPVGISCGDGSNDCTEAYDPGTPVTLTATEDPAFNFVGWTGDCTGPQNTCVVTMNTAKSVTANFEPPSTVESIRVTPDSAFRTVGQTQQYTATVTCNFDPCNQAVTWTISRRATITATGVASSSAVGTYTVRATSVADPNVSDTALLIVTAGAGGCPNDTDCDGVLNGTDNCPTTFNPSQEDDDDDGVGNACETDVTCSDPGAWSLTSELPNETDRGFIAALHTVGNTLYAGGPVSSSLDPQTISKTTDGGQTWIPTGALVTDPDETIDIRVIESNGNTLLAAGSTDNYTPDLERRGMIFRSTNGGTTWTRVGNFPGLVYALEFLDGAWYAGATKSLAEDATIYTSLNDGQTWSVHSTLSDIRYLNDFEFYNNNLYFAGGQYTDPSNSNLDVATVRKYNASTQTWSTVPGVSGREAQTLLLFNNELFVGTWAALGQPQVYKTATGASFSVVTTLPEAYRVHDLSAVDGTIYAGTSAIKHIYKSTDGGQTWIPSLLSASAQGGYAIEHIGNELYVGSSFRSGLNSHGVVYKSTHVPCDTPPASAVTVIIDPQLILARPGQNVQFTATVSCTPGACTNSAVTWRIDPGATISGTGNTATASSGTVGSYIVTATSVQDPTASDTATLIVSPLDGPIPDTCPASDPDTDGDGICDSVDPFCLTDTNWMQTAPVTGMRTISAIAERSGSIYVGGRTENYNNPASVGRIMRTDDGGVTWTASQNITGVQEVSALHTIGNDVYAGTWSPGIGARPVYKATGNGAFQLVGSIPTAHSINAFADINGVIFAGVQARDLKLVYKSTDGGQTWQVTGNVGRIENFDENALSVKSLLIVPGSGTSYTIYAGTNKGNFVDKGRVFKSTDAGATWTELADMANVTSVDSLALFNGSIYAGGTSRNPITSSQAGVVNRLTTSDTWQEVSRWGASSYVRALTVKDNTMIAGAGAVTYETTNGTTWVRKGSVNGIISTQIVFTGVTAYLGASNGTGVYKASCTQAPPATCQNGEPDTDRDGVCDRLDNCPTNPNPNQRDSDNDGIGDVCDPTPRCTSPDRDGDGVCDPVDNCPDRANWSQLDSDGDGIGDACDSTPRCNPAQDSDGDGVCDSIDNCPNIPNANQRDSDGDGIGDACDPTPFCDPANDRDGDRVCNNIDNCPDTPNFDQLDSDGDGYGDACDSTPRCNAANDRDGDGVCDWLDNCPDVPNATQLDNDGDGIGNACDSTPNCDPTRDSDGDGVCNELDNCPTTPNANQFDRDGDGIGDVCDSTPNCPAAQDRDGDGWCDTRDNCPNTPNPTQLDSDGDGIGDVCDSTPRCPAAQDADGDGVCNAIDNCPSAPNPDQLDTDGDGIGDACEVVDVQANAGIVLTIPLEARDNVTTTDRGDHAAPTMTVVIFRGTQEVFRQVVPTDATGKTPAIAANIITSGQQFTVYAKTNQHIAAMKRVRGVVGNTNTAVVFEPLLFGDAAGAQPTNAKQVWATPTQLFDCTVNNADLADIMSFWGTRNHTQEDGDKNGEVGAEDFAVARKNMNRSCIDLP